MVMYIHGEITRSVRDALGMVTAAGERRTRLRAKSCLMTEDADTSGDLLLDATAIAGYVNSLLDGCEITTKTIYNWIAFRGLPAGHFGTGIVRSKSAIREFFAARACDSAVKSAGAQAAPHHRRPHRPKPEGRPNRRRVQISGHNDAFPERMDDHDSRPENGR